MSLPQKTRLKPSQNTYRHISPQKRKLIRKTVKKQKRVPFGFFLTMLIFLCLVLPKCYSSFYDGVFFNRMNNSHIKMPDDNLLVNRAESSLANDYFLGHDLIASVNKSGSIFKHLPLTHKMSKLSNRLQYLINQNPQISPGIFVYDFTTGKYLDINAQEEFPTASMIKIPILLQLFKRAEMGYANLDSEMSITDYYLTGGSGYLQYRPVGTKLPVLNLAQKMIQESDNTATNMLLDTIGGVNDFNRALKLWGFSTTHMSNWLPDLNGANVSTPYDFGRMLFNMDNPDFLTLSSRVKITDIMSHVKNRFLIQAGLPDNVSFVHKTGDIGHMLGDAGIVNLPDGRKYIVVIMVKRPWNSYTAKQFIIDSSKVIYNSYVSNDL